MKTAIGYIRISSEDQADSGLGLAAQRLAGKPAAARAIQTSAAYRIEYASSETPRLVRGLAHVLVNSEEQAMRFAGKLLYKGEVVLDPASGDLWETPTGGAPSWGGHFDPTLSFGTGNDYELVLNDGRRGTIVVGSVSFVLNRPTAVSFRGSGPLK